MARQRRGQFYSGSDWSDEREKRAVVERSGADETERGIERVGNKEVRQIKQP